MKKNFAICLILLFSVVSKAQETEFANFQKELNSYIDFTLSRPGYPPINETNRNKFSKAVDDAFKTFVLQKNSNTYDKLLPVKNDPNSKLMRPDGRIYIETKTFSVNSKTYVAYGYESYSKTNYVIKEIETNTIVYEGDSKTYLIDGIYAIDETHFLLVEKNGHIALSRSAFVLSGKKTPWIKVNAFEGKAFGQVPGRYHEKKFVKSRDELQLDYDIPSEVVADDVNKISFDPATKTLSYKQYFEKNKSKTVKAKWEQNKFIIDDCDANESLSQMSEPTMR